MKAMIEQVKVLVSQYPTMKQQQRLLLMELNGVGSISEQDIIDQMTYTRSDGPAVMHSGTADRTAQIAADLTERLADANRKRTEQLQTEYLRLTQELTFFEGAAKALTGRSGEVFRALYLEGVHWRELEDRLYMARSNIYYQRNKAVRQLAEFYDVRGKVIPDWTAC